MRDPDTGNSKGFAFINFASFEASDAAIEAMNGQHLCNRAITVSYAFKKDSKGERHGSAAGEERREGEVVKQREERVGGKSRRRGRRERGLTTLKHWFYAIRRRRRKRNRNEGKGQIRRKGERQFYTS